MCTRRDGARQRHCRTERVHVDIEHEYKGQHGAIHSSSFSVESNNPRSRGSKEEQQMFLADVQRPFARQRGVPVTDVRLCLAADPTICVRPPRARSETDMQSSSNSRVAIVPVGKSTALVEQEAGMEAVAPGAAYAPQSTLTGPAVVTMDPCSSVLGTLRAMTEKELCLEAAKYNVDSKAIEQFRDEEISKDRFTELLMDGMLQTIDPSIRLRAMTKKELWLEAAKYNVDSNAIEQLRDDEMPKGRFIELISRSMLTESTGAEGPMQAPRDDLASLKGSGL